jgi:hypothetical protein
VVETVAWIADLALVPSLAVAMTAGLLVVLDDRRLTLAALAVQYLFVAWLAAAALPLGVAAAKLAAGLLACLVLGVSTAGMGWRAAGERAGALPTGPTFRWIAVLLVAIVAFAIGRDGWEAIPSLRPNVALGAMFLLTLGMLQIGITDDTLRVGVGILTLLSGFEVAYTAVETALAVMALLASVHLGVALVVSYLMVALADAAASKGGGD